MTPLFTHALQKYILDTLLGLTSGITMAQYYVDTKLERGIKGPDIIYYQKVNALEVYTRTEKNNKGIQSPTSGGDDD